MNPFKRKKDKFPKQSAPRTMDAIKQEYAELRARSGELQYQVFIGERNLTEINARLVQVHNEANEREALDKQTAAAPTTTVETQAVSQQNPS
jgi:hypothetical protein